MVDVLQGKLEELRRLCKRLGVRRLDVFGSATGRARKPFEPGESDFDLLVDFGPPPPGMGVADQYFEVLEGVQAILGAPVDLVDDAAIRNPYFRETVDAQREPIYVARSEEAAV